MDEYDVGLLNDWGGGNVAWWHDYLRYEIGRANSHWIQQTESLRAELAECRAKHMDDLLALSATAKAERELRAELAECKQDAERYRWLTYDHDDAEQRKRCREIWDRGCVMSYSALSVYIDAAMAGGE